MERHVIQYQTVHFNLNGKDVERTVDVRASLTDMLRNDFRMTSVKKGCEVGECGACTVIIDGEAFNSCIYLAVWAEGKHITTLEGLLGPNGELSDIQQAFVEEAAIQCGFCTPGSPAFRPGWDRSSRRRAPAYRPSSHTVSAVRRSDGSNTCLVILRSLITR